MPVSKQKTGYSEQNKWTRDRSTVSMVTETTTETEPDCVPLLAIQSPRNKTDSRIKVQLEIQGIEMTMELDTGASVSIISNRVLGLRLICRHNLKSNRSQFW